MRSSDRTSLWHALRESAGHSGASLSGASGSVRFQDLVGGSCLDGQAEALRHRSVLVATADQFTAAMALIELDGMVRRLVLCPPDFPHAHLPYVIQAAQVDAIVSDWRPEELGIASVAHFPVRGTSLAAASYDRTAPLQTEWVLLTSGTTGRPKLVAHTLASLSGAIDSGTAPVVWSTFYDIRRYGGLQIFLRAVLTGSSLVLGGVNEAVEDFLARAAAAGVTQISGTPSHWRRALMSPAAHLMDPRYTRLSGEIADQAILNHLQSFYPQASVSHAFASTECGVAFNVPDGLAGFPASWIGRPGPVEMKVEDGSLRIRSARTADRYLGEGVPPVKGPDGFVDTGDMLELRNGRYYFVGRRDGVINVGGLKVHPEEVEAVINRHPQVRMSLVRTRKNPITGALVVADVVLRTAGCSGPGQELQRDILHLCRETLAPHKVPAAIQFVASLAVAETGKLVRRHA